MSQQNEKDEEKKETQNLDQSENQANEEAGKTSKKSKDSAKSQAELTSLKAQNEKLQTELDSTKETLLRTAAEYENFRKRSVKEKETSFSNGLSHAVEKLLPVMDTLTLAVNVETTDENFKKGVQLTLDQCTKSFETLGIKEMKALGEMFDPNMHAAVMQEEAADDVESGTITKVLQPGYILGDKVIRHATVAVAN